ncbi:MAG: hypothetical protein FJ038_10700 [Chloroflexi bacterium]|nr:hypothetical protein [Chloroflexota bacterium]
MFFECFGIGFPSEALLGDVDTPAAPSAGEFIRWLNEDREPNWPTEGWRLLAEASTGTLYGVRAPDGAASPAYVVTIRETGDGWQAEDSGACTPTVHLEAGIGAATWETADTIGAGTTGFVALVTEVACASGQSSEDRIVAPRITVEPDAITVTFGVAPLKGDQDCQGNEPSPYEVTLPEPLGDRELRDGGIYPAHVVYP